jgi:hypothetical protein
MARVKASYECGKCGKKFGSVQGLGGHSAGHNKRKRGPYKSRVEAKPPANGQSYDGQLALKLLGLLCENPVVSKRAIEAFYLLDGKGD